MKISVFFVAAAIAYGALAVPVQPNLATREITNVEPINAREISDSLVEAREIETEDIFEREPRGRGGGGGGRRSRRSRSRGRRGRSRRRASRAAAAAAEQSGGGEQVEGREFDEEFNLDAREVEDQEEIFGRAVTRVSYYYYSILHIPNSNGSSCI
jgi:hypothetical protein